MCCIVLCMRMLLPEVVLCSYLRNKLDGFMRRIDRNNENNPNSDL